MFPTFVSGTSAGKIMRKYYDRPYPTLKEVIRNKTYDYISGRACNKNGEEEFLTAFRASRGFIYPLRRDLPLNARKNTCCEENERVIASEEWLTEDIPRGLTVIISHDFNDYSKEERATRPFSEHNSLETGTHVEIICNSGEKFSGDIRDGFLMVNDDKISSTILLEPDKDCMANKAGNIMIPLSFVQTIRKKEEYPVP